MPLFGMCVHMVSGGTDSIMACVYTRTEQCMVPIYYHDIQSLMSHSPHSPLPV